VRKAVAPLDVYRVELLCWRQVGQGKVVGQMGLLIGQQVHGKPTYVHDEVV